MQWARDELEVETDRYGLFDSAVPRITLRATERTGPMRLALWAGDERVAGWSIPHVPADSMLTIEGRTAIGTANGQRRVLSNFLRGWDDDWPREVSLPHGTYRLTLDQHPDRAVEVLVGVRLAATKV